MVVAFPTKPMPRTGIWLAAAALLAAFPSPGDCASPGLRFLVRGDKLCDDTGVLCLHASITWEPNARLLELYGRVTATVEPGTFVIVFRGHQRDGTVRYTEMSIPLNGHYSEIARDKIIPDWPEIDDWAVDHGRYERRAAGAD